MGLAELLLAGALLTGTEIPTWAEDPAAVQANFALLRHAILSTAVAWEILDERELGFTMTRPIDFAYDLKVLQRRYHDLIDAPPLADTCRFPDRGVLNELIDFNRKYRENLDEVQTLEVANWWSLRSALNEVDWMYQVYDTLRDARCDYYYVYVRRMALKRVRELIGDNAFERAELPPHVPAWRMQTIN
jgi:hypothetical protein